MKMIIMVIFLIFNSGILSAQQRTAGELFIPDSSKMVVNTTLFSDSLASSFAIEIKKGVKLHKHESHAEHVYIVSGQAVMTLGDKQFTVKAGDVVFIPRGMPHKVLVNGEASLRIISIQAPEFDGKDRIMLE